MNLNKFITYLYNFDFQSIRMFAKFVLNSYDNFQNEQYGRYLVLLLGTKWL